MALIIRGDDNGVAVGIQHHLVGGEDALAGAREAQHVLGRLRLIGFSDGFAQVGGTEGLGIAQPQVLEAGALFRAGAVQQVAQRQAFGVGGRKVILGLELPLGKVGLKPEIGQGRHGQSSGLQKSFRVSAGRRDQPSGAVRPPGLADALADPAHVGKVPQSQQQGQGFTINRLQRTVACEQRLD